MRGNGGGASGNGARLASVGASRIPRPVVRRPAVRKDLADLEAAEDVSTAETTLKMSSWWSANPSSHGHELTSHSLFSNVIRHSPSSKTGGVRIQLHPAVPNQDIH